MTVTRGNTESGQPGFPILGTPRRGVSNSAAFFMCAFGLSAGVEVNRIDGLVHAESTWFPLAVTYELRDEANNFLAGDTKKVVYAYTIWRRSQPDS